MNQSKIYTLKVVVITVIICTLVFSSIGVVALTLYADDIIYNPKNSDFKVEDAQGALDYLYTKVNESNNSAVSILSSLTNVSLPYTVPADGVISVTANVTMTNHDNSASGQVYVSILKNGSAISTGAQGFGEWSLVSASTSKVFEVKKGDVVSYTYGKRNMSWEAYIGMSANASAVYAKVG